MSALLHWLAGVVASADGTTPSSTRIAGMLLILTLIVGTFVHIALATLTLIASTALLCLGIRDGGPLDSWFQTKVAVAATAAGVPPPPLPGVSP